MKHSFTPMMRKKVLFLFLTLITVLPLAAQSSRSYIKERMRSWGYCRNVALTDTGGDVALNARNQYAVSGVPRSLAETLDDLNDKGEFIDDVQLTEDGTWLVLYGDNGFWYSDIPDDLKRTLKRANNDGEIITSVTFNDRDNWIVISTEHIWASSSKIYDFIQEGMEQYGNLWAAHLTDDGLVLVFERGYKQLGDVPRDLWDALDDTKLDVYRLKFTSGGAYFFADKNGYYESYM